jgi:hypothetical protein
MDIYQQHMDQRQHMETSIMDGLSPVSKDKQWRWRLAPPDQQESTETKLADVHYHRTRKGHASTFLMNLWVLPFQFKVYIDETTGTKWGKRGSGIRVPVVYISNTAAGPKN